MRARAILGEMALMRQGKRSATRQKAVIFVSLLKQARKIPASSRVRRYPL